MSEGHDDDDDDDEIFYDDISWRRTETYRDFLARLHKKA
jgi:hypothetical protein